MEKKVTEKEMFNKIKVLCAEFADVVKFCDKKIDALSRKRTNSKANEQTLANMELVYNALNAVVIPVTVGELIARSNFKALENENGSVTPQKVSSYLSKLKEDCRVGTMKEKKMTKFYVLTEEQAEKARAEKAAKKAAAMAVADEEVDE